MIRDRRERQTPPSTPCRSVAGGVPVPPLGLLPRLHHPRAEPPFGLHRVRGALSGPSEHVPPRDGRGPTPQFQHGVRRPLQSEPTLPSSRRGAHPTPSTPPPPHATESLKRLDPLRFARADAPRIPSAPPRRRGHAPTRRAAFRFRRGLRPPQSWIAPHLPLLGGGSRHSLRRSGVRPPFPGQSSGLRRGICPTPTGDPGTSPSHDSRRILQRLGAALEVSCSARPFPSAGPRTEPWSRLHRSHPPTGSGPARHVRGAASPPCGGPCIYRSLRPLRRVAGAPPPDRTRSRRSFDSR